MKKEARKNSCEPPVRFFNDITPLVYDLQFRPEMPDIDFWVRWCLEVGGPVLELCCGNGRVAIPLARAGLEVVGVDLSEPMLATARKRLASESEEVQKRVKFYRRDMRDFNLDIKVGCVIIPVSTFTLLLTREDQEKTLGNIRAYLKEGGRFGFELRIFDDWLGGDVKLPPRDYVSADGAIAFIEERRFEFDPSSRIFTSINTYTFRAPENLGTFTEHQKARVIAKPEMEELLQGAGFAVKALWGDYDRRPFSAESGRMIFVARKAE